MIKNKLFVLCYALLIPAFLFLSKEFSWFSGTEPHQNFHRAVFWGKSQLSSSEKILWKELGIYHLLIISGFHFNLVLQPLQKQSLLLNSFFALSLLLFWNFSPSIGRACSYFLLNQVSKSLKLQWNLEIKHILCMILVFFLCKDSYEQYALFLSICFSYLFCLFSTLKLPRPFVQSFIFITSPFLLPSGAKLHFLSYLVNLLLLPLILLFLLFSPLIHILPKGQQLCQIAFSSLQRVMHFGITQIPLTHTTEASGSAQCFYLILCLTSFWGVKTAWKRKQLFSSSAS